MIKFDLDVQKHHITYANPYHVLFFAQGNLIWEMYVGYVQSY